MPLPPGTKLGPTFDPSEEVTPIWSRDGQKLAYRLVKVTTTVQMKNLKGTEKEKEVFAWPPPFAFENIPNSWSADGAQILCTSETANGATYLGLVSTAGAGIKPFLKGTAHYSNGQFSPDGKWVAYASDDLECRRRVTSTEGVLLVVPWRAARRPQNCQ